MVYKLILYVNECLKTVSDDKESLLNLSYKLFYYEMAWGYYNSYRKRNGTGKSEQTRFVSVPDYSCSCYSVVECSVHNIIEAISQSDSPDKL